MGVIPNAEAFLYTGLGVLLMLGSRLIKAQWQKSTEERRRKVDEVNNLWIRIKALESYERKLTESLHVHRIMLINRGVAERELPDFPERE